MPSVTFILPDGTAKTVACRPGASVMEAAVTHGIPGIDGDCGGCMACGTCHVRFSGSAPSSEEEETVLSALDQRHPDSRLGCQIIMGQSSDETIIVRLP